MHLLGRLSNPSAPLMAVFEALPDEPIEPRQHPAPQVPVGRLGNGEVQRAVVKVLAAAKRPMRTADVHRGVEDLLSIPVSRDSVNSCLSTKARGEHPAFVRTEPAVYWLANRRLTST